MGGPAVEFVAPCPRGHAGATWWTVLEDVPGAAGWDHLGQSRPGHRVLCGLCPDGDDGAGDDSAGDSAGNVGAGDDRVGDNSAGGDKAASGTVSGAAAPGA